jgi:hypothetical protein
VDDFDISHAQTGRNFIRCPGQSPDLADDPELWAEVWRGARDELLRRWIGLYPGTRPPAWWEFEAPSEPMGDDEPEYDYLDRIGELDPAELEAIRLKAVGLAEYDRGRDPEPTQGGYYRNNFIPPGDLHAFAARKGLLTAEERAVLGLDERGRFLFPIAGKGRPAAGKDGEDRVRSRDLT